MRKKLLLGSLFAVVLILMIPMVSAIEYKTAYPGSNSISIQDGVVDAILKKYNKNPQPTGIIIKLTILILFLKLIRWSLSHYKWLIILYIILHFSG